MNVIQLDKNDIHMLAHKGIFLTLYQGVPVLSYNPDLRLIKRLLRQEEPYDVYLPDNYRVQSGGSTWDEVLRALLSVSKVTVGVAAIAATGGVGGDTIVNIISVTITTSKVLQVVLTTMEEVGSTNPYLSQIFSISFSEGPEGVEQAMQKIWDNMHGSGDGHLADGICILLDSMLTIVSDAFGDWISAIIPDDAGITGIVISEILRNSSESTYDTIVSLYNRIPEDLKHVFTDPVAMKKFLNDILIECQKVLSGSSGAHISGPLGFTNFPNPMFLASRMIPGVSGVIMNRASSYVTDKFRPAIDPAVRGFNIIIPLVFCILYSKKLCVNNDFITYTHRDPYLLAD